MYQLYLSHSLHHYTNHCVLLLPFIFIGKGIIILDHDETIQYRMIITYHLHTYVFVGVLNWCCEIVSHMRIPDKLHYHFIFNFASDMQS